MKVKILKPVLGFPTAKVGDVIDMPDYMAHKYLQLGLIQDPNALAKKKSKRGKNGKFVKATE
jgi:hypothetical protein